MSMKEYNEMINNLDKAEKRTVELARTCREQRTEIDELKEIINEIYKIQTEKGQGTIVERYDKIKKLVDDYQSKN